MKILFACNKLYWDRKIPRTRFQVIDALACVDEVYCSGVGFDDWTADKSIKWNAKQIGIEFDWLIVYKPSDYRGWEENKIPVATTMNDMWDLKQRWRDIAHPQCKLVVCHHANEVDMWRSRLPKIHFENIPYPVDTDVFYNKGRESLNFGVFLTGAVDADIYPLRHRFRRMIDEGEFSPLVASYRNHPGYRLDDPIKEMHKYATLLNNVQIGLFDTSKYNYWPEKILEYAACGAVPAGNLPDERHEEFRRIGLVIDPTETNRQIAMSVKSLLDDEDLMNEKRAYGQWYCEEMCSMSSYAQRLHDLLWEHR